MARPKKTANIEPETREDDEDDFDVGIPTDRPIISAAGIETVQVKITGISALLHHRFGEQIEVEETTRSVHIQRGSPRAQAEEFAYRMPDKSLYLPGAAIMRLLRESGSSHRERSSRKSIKYIIPAAVLVLEDAIPLLNGDGESRITTFEVDSRPVCIPSTKGRIMRHRPRMDQWSALFTLEIDRTMIDSALVHQLITEGGRRIGIGDFRPERGGPFGRFRIVEWTSLKESKSPD